MNSEGFHAVIVTTTADSESLLEDIGAKLVEKKLAACCQISGPVTSIYRWQGNVDRSKEWLCTIKSVPALVDQVSSTIRSLHSYDEPEIVVTPIVDGSESYLEWIIESVQQ